LLIVDGHLDLAANALYLRRDLTRTAEEVRRSDTEEIRKNFGSCTVTLPELRKGGVGIVFATVWTRVDPAAGYAGAGFPTQMQCYAVGRAHAAYYEALERAGEVSLLRQKSDLEAILEGFRERPSEAPLGLLMSMECADPILDPEHVAHWWSLGLRIASLTQYGKGVYAHGTGSTGGLLPQADELLKALEAHGIVLDLTHLTDEGLKQALEKFSGMVVATHHNCRALVPGQRQLADEMIRDVAARGGVIGTALDLAMLDPKFNRAAPKRNVGLSEVTRHIDHICQITGSSDHAAIGSDMDGGLGLEHIPSGVETVADLPLLQGELQRAGFSEEDIKKVMYGNWIRLLQGSLPERAPGPAGR
jgi:membrane dipeptidase